MCIVDRRDTNEVVGAVRPREGVLPEHKPDGFVPEDTGFEHAETQHEEELRAGKRGLGVDVVVKGPGPRVFEELFLERVCRSGGI